MGFNRSPSSRRAWIEILPYLTYKSTIPGSPSSRRAWIEIFVTSRSFLSGCVALLAEGVD